MNHESVKVYVLSFDGRRNLYMRAVDPVSGRLMTRSTGTPSKNEAAKIAAKWEAELEAGRYKPPSKLTWDEFRELYMRQAVPAMAKESFGKIKAVFNSVERHLAPKKLRDLDAARIALWQHTLRDAELSESSIASYSSTLRAMLNWAHGQGLLSEVPKIRMPKRARKSDGRTPMKGRPITSEEFERMLDKTADVVGCDRAEGWKRLLQGLWLSGLRISEAHRLSWQGDQFSVDMTGQHPMLRIDADHEKGNRDRFLPIAPEFAEFLLSTPEHERVGWAFQSKQLRGERRASQDVMERTVAKIGQAAGVKVLERTFKGEPKTKYASAQDLRRAFGTHWAVRVMPPVLQQLMRHETISTTLRYSVGLDAQSTMDQLYASVGHSFGHTAGNAPQNRARRQDPDSPQVSTE